MTPDKVVQDCVTLIRQRQTVVKTFSDQLNSIDAKLEAVSKALTSVQIDTVPVELWVADPYTAFALAPKTDENLFACYQGLKSKLDVLRRSIKQPVETVEHSIDAVKQYAQGVLLQRKTPELSVIGYGVIAKDTQTRYTVTNKAALIAEMVDQGIEDCITVTIHANSRAMESFVADHGTLPAGVESVTTYSAKFLKAAK